MLPFVSAQTAHDSWMSSLRDTMPVCRVSIPGTHDSGTAGVRFPMRYYASTQSMDLGEQWNAGIRFFDLRPKPAGGKLKIFHGPADCHLTLEEVLHLFRHKLESNPTEFCVIMTNMADGGQQATDMVMELIRTVIPSDMLAVFRKDMTVSDVRGRILFIHRDAPSKGTGFPGVVVRGWPGNGLSWQPVLVSSEGESAGLWAQDLFTSGSNNHNGYLSHKWDSMYRLLRAFEDADDGVWCINHASGYTGTGVSTNIRRNVRSTNARLLNYLKTHHGPVGIIPMDFPSQELIDAIIECNK